MIEFFDDHLQAVLWAGFALGIAYGAAAQWSRFCLYRGLVNHWQKGDSVKLHAFMLAMAIALLTSQALQAFSGIDLTNTHYHQRSPSWPLLIGGGVLFGYGMHLANACGARSLVLLGSGNLRSLMVLLVLGISAYITMSGLLAQFRLDLETMTQSRLPVTSIDGLLAITGLSPVSAKILTLIIFAGALLFTALKSAGLRNAYTDLNASVVIGILVATGWWITGVLGADDFDPVRLASLTFVAPIGETLQFTMLSSGMSLSFAVVVVLGVILGSFIRAILSGEFSWQSYDSPKQMQRSIIGAVLMGVGGVLSLGCTLGQGISGFSTLAISSLAALLGILIGARFALWVDSH